jgi:hypothetical protein
MNLTFIKKVLIKLKGNCICMTCDCGKHKCKFSNKNKIFYLHNKKNNSNYQADFQLKLQNTDLKYLKREKWHHHCDQKNTIIINST